MDRTVETSPVVETCVGTFRTRLEYDEDATSPREFDGNVGVMVLSHKRYDLPNEDDDVHRALVAETEYGDPTPRRSFRAIERWIRLTRGATVVLVVYGYDHSGLAMTARARTYPFDDPWDSGVLGIVFDDADTREERFGEDQWTPELIEEALIEEVELYDHWAQGGYVGYVVETLTPLYDRRGRHVTDNWETLDSLWGIDDPKFAMSEGMSTLRWFVLQHKLAKLRGLAPPMDLYTVPGLDEEGPRVCRHCGVAVVPDPDNGWTHDHPSGAIVGCGAPFGEHDPRYAEPEGQE